MTRRGDQRIIFAHLNVGDVVNTTAKRDQDPNAHGIWVQITDRRLTHDPNGFFVYFVFDTVDANGNYGQFTGGATRKVWVHR